MLHAYSGLYVRAVRVTHSALFKINVYNPRFQIILIRIPRCNTNSGIQHKYYRLTSIYFGKKVLLELFLKVGNPDDVGLFRNLTYLQFAINFWNCWSFTSVSLWLKNCLWEICVIDRPISAKDMKYRCPKIEWLGAHVNFGIKSMKLLL